MTLKLDDNSLDRKRKLGQIGGNKIMASYQINKAEIVWQLPPYERKLVSTSLVCFTSPGSNHHSLQL